MGRSARATVAEASRHRLGVAPDRAGGPVRGESPSNRAGRHAGDAVWTWRSPMWCSCRAPLMKCSWS